MISTASLLELLKELTEYACSDVPETNCSCHITPPCNDCVTHAHQRELAKESKSVQQELLLLLLLDPTHKI